LPIGGGMRRELLSGMLLGTVLIIGFIRVGVWHSTPDFTVRTDDDRPNCRFLAGGVVLWGTLRFHAAHLPQNSAPTRPYLLRPLATLVDVTGLIIYFSFAYLFLQGILL
jgi:magnesium transporter